MQRDIQTVIINHSICNCKSQLRCFLSPDEIIFASPKPSPAPGGSGGARVPRAAGPVGLLRRRPRAGRRQRGAGGPAASKGPVCKPRAEVLLDAAPGNASEGAAPLITPRPPFICIPRMHAHCTGVTYRHAAPAMRLFLSTCRPPARWVAGGAATDLHARVGAAAALPTSSADALARDLRRITVYYW